MAPVKKVKPIENVISGQLAKKLAKKQRKQQKLDRGVVLIRHLPNGFYEEQLKKYFQQFGRVTRLRLVRSRRTGGCKGFAYIEFQYPEVAKVAAETMNNYLMFKKLVKAVYIPPEEQKYDYFETSVRKVKNKAGKEIYISAKTAAIQRQIKAHNLWTDETYQKRTNASLNKLKKKEQKFAHLGLNLSSVVMGWAENSGKNGKSKIDDVIATSDSNESSERTQTDIGLGDLLGDTIIDDSNDEDYVDTSASSDNITVSFKKSNGVNQDFGSKNIIDNAVRSGGKVNVTSKNKLKNTKKEISLEDLLGNTIDDDSNDEDYNKETGNKEKVAVNLVKKSKTSKIFEKGNKKVTVTRKLKNGIRSEDNLNNKIDVDLNDVHIVDKKIAATSVKAKKDIGSKSILDKITKDVNKVGTTLDRKSKKIKKNIDLKDVLDNIIDDSNEEDYECEIGVKKMENLAKTKKLKKDNDINLVAALDNKSNLVKKGGRKIGGSAAKKSKQTKIANLEDLLANKIDEEKNGKVFNTSNLNRNVKKQVNLGSTKKISNKRVTKSLEKFIKHKPLAGGVQKLKDKKHKDISNLLKTREALKVVKSN